MADSKGKLKELDHIVKESEKQGVAIKSKQTVSKVNSKRDGQIEDLRIQEGTEI